MVTTDNMGVVTRWLRGMPYRRVLLSDAIGPHHSEADVDRVNFS